MSSKALTLFILLLAAPAWAQAVADAPSIDVVATIAASPLAGDRLHALDNRYVALGELLYDGTPHVDLIDVERRALVRVTTAREPLVKRFGVLDLPPEGQPARFDGARLGMVLADRLGARRTPERRHWYVELDAKTGTVVRERSLGVHPHSLHVLGYDAVAQELWLYAIVPGELDHGPRAIGFKRLALPTLALRDAVTIELPSRRLATGYEDMVTVHRAADFSRFAVVEYTEQGLAPSPPAKVYFVTPATGAVFSVPAPATTYGVAFARHHAFLVSAQRSIARVDLAAKTIGQTAPAPDHAHHAVLSRDGTKLYVLATSSRYAVFDPETLRVRERDHAPGLSAAMSQLFGGGVATPDGAHFIVPHEQNDPGSSGSRFLVTKLR